MYNIEPVKQQVSVIPLAAALENVALFQPWKLSQQSLFCYGNDKDFDCIAAHDLFLSLNESIIVIINT